MDVRDLILPVCAALTVAQWLFYFVIEIAFVGKAPGQYAMLLGGGYHGQRLNKIYRGWYLVFLSQTILNFLCRICERTRNPSHSPPYDQALCFRTSRG